jgi:hypothetical protein
VLRMDFSVLLMVGFGPFGLQIGGFFWGHYCEILGRLLTAVSFWVAGVIGCS